MEAERNFENCRDEPACAGGMSIERFDREAAVDVCVGGVYKSGQNRDGVIEVDLNFEMKDAGIPTL